MTQLLYLENSYLKQCGAIVTEVLPEGIVLDQTVFYPTGGGQPSDTGSFTRTSDGKQFKVTETKKNQGKIVHRAELGLIVGDKLQCILDWQRRYTLMRMHTAAHVLSAVAQNKSGALITGNQLDLLKSRMDFSIESFDREALQTIVHEANKLLAQNHEVTTYTASREQVVQNPAMVKLAAGLPEHITELRIVKIGTIDEQPDGGTHVKNTKEVGSITIVKLENMGVGRKRVYFALENI